MIRDPSSPARESAFRVGDMDCPSCVARIENRLKKLDGVVSVRASVVSRTLKVWHEDGITPAQLGDEVGKLGYLALPREEEGSTSPGSAIWSSRKALITYGAVTLFAVGLGLRLAGQPGLSHPVFTLAALAGGMNFFGKGLRSARRLSLDMNFLMTIAILGALAIGETLEAAAIAFLFSLAELLESFAVDRARASVTALVELAPDTARLVRGQDEVVVPAEALEVGDRVRVRPGERIPVDGEVTEGVSDVNQAPITGESLPVPRGPGGPVFAGTVNGDGLLEIRVSHPASESTLARIGRMIEEAEGRRARSERFVERFAAYYTPAVTLAAILVVAVPPLLFGSPFQPWFLRGLTLLVIACPCALVISTPVAVVSGITAAAKRGVLIKGGVYLESLGRIRTVAFDKTGTLTIGHPQVVEILPVGGNETGSEGAPGPGSEKLLRLAAAVESASSHPIARAISEAWEMEDSGERKADVTDARNLPGLGAVAVVEGVETMVLKPEALPDFGVSARPPGRLTSAGHTVVGVAADRRLLGWIALADTVRPGSRESLFALRQVGVERVVMLTGDHPGTASAIASSLGVDEVRAGLMPEDKVDAIRELAEAGNGVVMVGDGVNDGPALAAATVGVAMGSAGSAVALETADVALLGDDIGRMPYLMRLSQRASRVIRQNIAAAILLKLVLAAGVPLGLVSLVTAVVVGDMGVSLAVILNALRLGRVGSRQGSRRPGHPPTRTDSSRPSTVSLPGNPGEARDRPRP